MKKYLQIILILLLLFISINALFQNVIADEINPYTIYGTVKDQNEIEVPGSAVIIENLNTKESNGNGNDTITGFPITITTDSNGMYIFELKNLKSGYKNGDEITITAEKEGLIGTNTIIIGDESWGTSVDINLGCEKTQEKESWYNSTSNIWILYISMILFVLILLVMLKKSKSKPLSSTSIEIKRELPPPPKHKVQKDELVPTENDIPENELPPPDDEISEYELTPPDDEIPEDDLPPPDDWILEDELPHLDDEISEEELPPPNDEILGNKSKYGSLSRIGMFYIISMEIIITISMVLIRSNIEVL